MDAKKDIERAQKTDYDSLSGRERKRNRGSQEFKNYDEIIILWIRKQRVRGNSFSTFL